MAFLVAVQGGQGAADVPSDRLQQLQLPGLEGFRIGLEEEHGAVVAGAVEEWHGQAAFAWPGVADQDRCDGSVLVAAACAARLAQGPQVRSVFRGPGIDRESGAAEAQRAGTQSDQGFHVVQHLQQGVPGDRRFGQGVGSAIQELQGAVAAGQGLGLLLDSVFQFAIDPRQVLHHEVEGFTELSQLIRFPLGNAYIEIATLHEARRGEQLAEGAQHMALELKHGAGAERQQQGQRHALDQSQPLKLGLQPFLHQGDQAVDAGHDPRGIFLQGPPGGGIRAAAEHGGPVVLAPFSADLVVSLSDGVGPGGRDGLQEVRVGVAAFEFGQRLIQPGGGEGCVVEAHV